MKITNLLCKISLLSLTLLFATTLSAQNFSFKEGKVMYEESSRDAIVVVMAPETKEVKKAWEDFIKDRFDVKMKGIGLFSNEDVLSAEDVNIAAISSKNMNLYTKVVEKGMDTEMSVFASFGYDIYLNEENYPTEYGQLKETVKKFLESYLLTYYKEEVEETRELVEDTSKNRTKVKKDIAGNKKEIKELMEKNEKLEKELVEVEQNLTKFDKKLRDRSTDLKAITEALEKLKKN